MNIPTTWTFESDEVAKNFNSHVREQLPWYDLATEAVQYIVRNYLPEGGTVVDIGASTGNMVDKLLPLIAERQATIIAVETSEAMLTVLEEKYALKTNVLVLDEDLSKPTSASIFADVYILFLTTMFVPVSRRQTLFDNLRRKVNDGGIIIVVDKVLDHNGYFGTVMKRLGMHFKVLQNADPSDILRKEMSLAGVQIPIDASLVADGKQFFRVGEFCGWVIES